MKTNQEALEPLLSEAELRAVRWVIKKGPRNHMYSDDILSAERKIGAALRKLRPNPTEWMPKDK